MSFEDIIEKRRQQSLASMKRIQVFCQESIDHQESWANFKKTLSQLLEKEDKMLIMLLHEEKLP